MGDTDVFADPILDLKHGTPLSEAVFMALGAASVCWDDMTGKGVFESTRAKQIGDELLAFVQAQPRDATSIQDDPEFFYGLTMWADGLSAQVRDTTVVLFDRGRETENEIDQVAARRLRDLLNVATARGHL